MGAARGLGLKLVDHAIDAVRSGRQKALESAMARYSDHAGSG